MIATSLMPCSQHFLVLASNTSRLGATERNQYRWVQQKYICTYTGACVGWASWRSVTVAVFVTKSYRPNKKKAKHDNWSYGQQLKRLRRVKWGSALLHHASTLSRGRSSVHHLICETDMLVMLDRVSMSNKCCKNQRT